MDEKVKARLIGATVLVVLAVVLVPEMLSGPKPSSGVDAMAEKRETRTYTIDLDATGTGSVRATPEPPRQAASPREKPKFPTVPPSGAETQKVRVVPPPGVPSAARNSRTADVAATSTARTREATTTGARSVSDSPPQKTARIVPTSPAATVRGRWAVQVGAFGSVTSARKLVADLGRDGFTAYVAPHERGGKTLHRVRVGPQPTQDDARRLAARLEQRGLPAAVVGAE